MSLRNVVKCYLTLHEVQDHDLRGTYKLLQESKPTLQSWNVSEAARECSVEPDYVSQLVRRGLIPGPKIDVPGRRKKRYDAKGLTELKAALKTYSSSSVHEARLQAGFYSLADVEKTADIAPSTLLWHIRKGRVKRPTHTYRNHRASKFYNRDEYEQVIDWLKTNVNPAIQKAHGKGKTLSGRQVAPCRFK